MWKKFIYISLFIVILVSCQKYNASENQITDSQKKIDIKFSTGDISPTFDENIYSVYNVSSLNTKFPFYITVKGPEDTKITINDIPAKVNSPFQIKLDKLEWDGRIIIKINEKEYKVNHIPDSYPRYVVSIDNPSPGEVYLSQDIPPTILSEKGELLYYCTVENRASDFKKVRNKNGDVRYVMIKEINVPQVEGGGYYQGTVIIMNERFEIIKEIKPLSPSAELNYFSENHDFIFIDDNHYIFSMYSPKTVHNVPSELDPNPLGVKVIAAHLQEVKDNNVIWEWISTDYPHFYKSSIDGNNFSETGRPFADYMHLNSVTIDPEDDNLIISLRNQWAIVKIDRTTGELIWTLSGKNDDFGLIDDQYLKGQHYAKVFANSDGTKTITAFDNRSGEPQSRVVEYTIDENNKTLVNFYKLNGPYSGPYMGSAQKLENDRYFIGWGGFDGVTFSATEISRDGTKIYFNLLLPPNIYSYRAQKFE